MPSEASLFISDAAFTGCLEHNQQKQREKQREKKRETGRVHEEKPPRTNQSDDRRHSPDPESRGTSDVRREICLQLALLAVAHQL